MEKLDRLGWAEGLALSTFGVRVGVRVSVPGVLSRILPQLPPRWRKTRRSAVQRLYSLVMGDECKRGGTRRLHVLYANTARLARGTELDEVLEALGADLMVHTAQMSPDKTFLHAGVVGWQGRTILIPGRSLTGKSTLVRELLGLGATYYSDEFAVVDSTGLVHPFPGPLGIREQGSYVQAKCPVEKLGAIVGAEPLPAGVVVITQYQTGARWEPTLLSRGQGALELVANSIAIRNQPLQTLTRLQKLVGRAVFLRGPRGEAREVAASILRLLSDRSGQEAA